MGPPKESNHGQAHVASRHIHDQSSRRDARPRPEEYGLNDPVACINACRDQFMRARTGEAAGNNYYPEICRLLSRNERSEAALWELYTCDSTFCGVANCAVELDRE